nr:dihydroorotate dehydrogenase electron transfer subunit [Alkalibacillus aidingensis]
MRLQGEVLPILSQPGQFIHLKIGQVSEFMLRRPVSIADVDREEKSITIIYKVVGHGTNWLSTRIIGDEIDGLGPLGNGFSLQQHKGESILLVGGGVGVPPLYYAAKELSKHNHVTAVLGFQTSEAIFYESEFSQIAKTWITTDDGSYGYSGLVTELIASLGSFTTYYACGPNGMLKSVQSQLSDIKGYLSLEERMGCGIGACLACVCQTRCNKGYIKICKDGPVVNADEVIL